MTGTISDWRFEAMNLRLGPNLYYRPDFFIVTKEYFEFIEVKGFLRDDARAKFIMAAETYSFFRWRMVQAARTDPGLWKEMYKF